MSQENIRRCIMLALAAVLASTAAYLNVHGNADAGFLWFGVFICFMVVTG